VWHIKNKKENSYTIAHAINVGLVMLMLSIAVTQPIASTVGLGALLKTNISKRLGR